MAKRRTNKKTDPHGVRGLTAISVCGFKSLAEECHIDMRRLTILAGANNSGKSSIVQPLLMLKQTLDSQYDPGPLSISGPNVRFTDVDQFLPKIPGAKCGDNLSIKLEFDRENWVKFIFSPDKKKMPNIDQISYSVSGATGTMMRSMSQRQIKEILPAIAAQVEALAGRKKGRAKWMVSTDRCFINVEIARKKGEILPGYGLVYSPGQSVRQFITEIIHVPGLRGNPERFYRTTAIGPVYPGTFNTYVASIIRHWKDKKDRRLSELGNSLRVLGLTWKVDAKPLDATRVEIHVGRMAERCKGVPRDMVNIADVGFGVSQVLPVVVALLAARGGQLVYIEQPEIHLHPRAQVEMATLLAKAANKGVRLLIETHSSLLLLAIQTLVADGKLDPHRVMLHWFTRRREDGVTVVESANIDETGAFGEWPVDFGDVALGLESRYLDLAEKRLKRRKNAA